MVAQSIEEELAELAALVDEAERLGFDPWPPCTATGSPRIYRGKSLG